MTKTIRESRMEERRKLIADHIDELAREHGVVGHPKLSQLYSIAWDLGHSAGYNEVAIYFSQLVPLIK